ncbi:hypothetical protein [Halalkalibacter lacteus]|uniref:hypothetical protein n=1 Tax=Halalkalibacter lacteus TaxID=3090663 RepID=UPI002FCA11B7
MSRTSISNYDYNNQGTDPSLVHKSTHDANDSHDDPLPEFDDVSVGCELHDYNVEDSGDAIDTHARDCNLVDVQNFHVRDVQDRNLDGARRACAPAGNRVHTLRERMVPFLEMLLQTYNHLFLRDKISYYQESDKSLSL